MEGGKKVLMIAATPFFSDRGAHIRIYEEMEALKKSGYEVMLSTYHLGSGVDGVSIERSGKASWYTKLGPGASWGKLLIDPLLFIKSAVLCRRFRPDIIHAHLSEGLLIAGLLRLFSFSRAPIVYDSQGILSDEMDRYHFSRFSSLARKSLRYLFFAIERTLLFIPEKIVCSSGRGLQEYVARYSVASEKISVLSDGFSSAVFERGNMSDRDALRQQLGIKPQQKVFLYTGSLVEGKGAREYLESVPELLKRIPDSMYVFLGYGELENLYKEKYASYIKQGRVFFLGRRSYFELARYISIADYAIDPKKGSSESSAKIFNYLSLGIPVFCFQSPLPELDRYLIKIDSFDAIAQIVSSGKVPEKIDRETLRSHSWREKVKKLEVVYNELPIRKENKFLIRATVVLIVSISLIIVFRKFSAVSHVTEILKNTDPLLLFGSFVAYIGVYILRAHRFSLVSSVKSMWENFAISVAHTFAVNILPASIGEFAYPYLLKSKHGVSYAKSLGDLFLLRILDGINIVFLALALASNVFLGYGFALALFCFFAASFTIVPILFFIIRAFDSRLAQANSSKRGIWGKFSFFLSRMARAQTLHSLGRLFCVELSSLALCFAMLLYGFLLMKAFGLDLSFAALSFALCISVIGGAIPLDGLFSFGIAEVSLAGALARLGIAVPFSIALAVSNHLVTLVYSGILFVAVVVWRSLSTNTSTKSSV